jgi:ABC-type bacteriocin/lantibiotic exporter with double-glycine peptidase domain
MRKQETIQENYMIDLPTGRQTFNYDCGAKALQIVMAYYGVEVREDELMSQLGCGPAGTPVSSMIGIAEKYGFKVEVTHGISLDAVKNYVDQGFPVIILLQAWADRYMTLDDWRADTQDGHYGIVIQHGDHIVVFEDPSSFHRTWLTEEELLARWHDTDPESGERIEHFAMVLKGKEPAGKKIEHMN